VSHEKRVAKLMRDYQRAVLHVYMLHYLDEAAATSLVVVVGKSETVRALFLRWEERAQQLEDALVKLCGRHQALAAVSLINEEVDALAYPYRDHDDSDLWDRDDDDDDFYSADDEDYEAWEDAWEEVAREEDAL
jgi:hypothetical protein